jgi:hypothetical protein
VTSWIDDVGELNAEAHRLLDGNHQRLTDAPSDCPPAGSWVRIFYRPESGRPKAKGQWHLVVGWREQWATVQLRCRARYWVLNGVLEKPDNAYWRRLSLRVSTQRPARGVCRRCAGLVELDAVVEQAVAA